MKLDKKQIALTVGGIIASMVIAYLVYKMEQRDSAANAANAANEAAEEESELANQQQEESSLPSISVPTISANASTDTSTSSSLTGTDASDSDLEAIIAAFQATPSDSVTGASSPSGTITALPLPTSATIAPVIIPDLITPSTPTQSPQSYSNLTASNGLNLNLAKG